MAIRLVSALRIATLNVRGLSARRRQYQLSRLFAEHELDIIAVQETKVESHDQTYRMVRPFQLLFNVCVSHAVGFSGGGCLFIRGSVGIVETAVHSCSSGRLVCDFSSSNVEWRVICIYAPNRESERKVFYESIESYLNCDRVVILLGDFNCVCSPEDRVNQVRFRDSSSFSLSEIIARNTLEDVTVCASKEGVQYTHFQGNSHARLDRAYISLELVPLCDHYEVKHVPFSDHALVFFTLGNKKKSTRWEWALWKMKGCLVNDEFFISQVKELFQNLFVNDRAKWGEKWEVFKEDVKTIAIEKCSVITYHKKIKENDLRRKLDRVIAEESMKPGEFAKEIRDLRGIQPLVTQWANFATQT